MRRIALLPIPDSTFWSSTAHLSLVGPDDDRMVIGYPVCSRTHVLRDVSCLGQLQSHCILNGQRSKHKTIRMECSTASRGMTPKTRYTRAFSSLTCFDPNSLSSVAIVQALFLFNKDCFGLLVFDVKARVVLRSFFGTFILHCLVKIYVATGK